MKVIKLPPETPHKPVVEYLKELYDRAVAGDVTAIASIVVTTSNTRPGDAVETGWSFNSERISDSYMLASGASRLVFEMNRDTAWDINEP